MYSKRLFFLISILFFYNTSAAEVNSNYTRIVGGVQVTDLSEYPYQVSLRRLTSLGHFCGGILLNANHILTAAHCMFNTNQELIRAHEVYAVTGSLIIQPLSSSAVTSKVKYIFIHEKYIPSAYDNDIAILRLQSSITINDSTGTISLATSTIPADQECFASGWGKIRENGPLTNNLMSVRIPIVKHEICKQLYNPLITNNMICAGTTGKDACQGDSGGPLKCNDKIAGIVSFGNGCGRFGYPGVYTDVTKYHFWIKDQLIRAAAISIMPHNVIFALIILVALMHANIFLC